MCVCLCESVRVRERESVCVCVCNLCYEWLFCKVRFFDASTWLPVFTVGCHLCLPLCVCGANGLCFGDGCLQTAEQQPASPYAGEMELGSQRRLQQCPEAHPVPARELSAVCSSQCACAQKGRRRGDKRTGEWHQQRCE